MRLQFCTVIWEKPNSPKSRRKGVNPRASPWPRAGSREGSGREFLCRAALGKRHDHQDKEPAQNSAAF